MRSGYINRLSKEGSTKMVCSEPTAKKPALDGGVLQEKKNSKKVLKRL